MCRNYYWDELSLFVRQIFLLQLIEKYLLRYKRRENRIYDVKWVSMKIEGSIYNVRKVVTLGGEKGCQTHWFDPLGAPVWSACRHESRLTSPRPPSFKALVPQWANSYILMLSYLYCSTVNNLLNVGWAQLAFNQHTFGKKKFIHHKLILSI